MKKILLIIFLIMAIFQMVVMATAIDVGSEVIERLYGYSGGVTWILKENSANDTGNITSIEIYAYGDAGPPNDMSGVKVATFYNTTGNIFTARDSVTIGTVTAGAKRTFTLDSESNPISLAVQSGDYIGLYWVSGNLYNTRGGESGIWLLNEDQTSCSDLDFGALLSGWNLSLCGTGETAAVGIKWNTVTISKWNGQVITKLNGIQ